MQSNGLMNGHRTMNLQFVNETESVISESLGNDYGDFNLKRGLDSDSDSDGSKRMGYDPNGDDPMPVKQGKKTKGRVKIKMEFIDNKLRRYTTFSKRKTGIMKKAYELSTLTGTQVMLLVASETGHVYTFATKKLQPMITSESGKALIQTCLNSPDGMMVSPSQTVGSDQRMNPTGFEETELNYGISDEEREESPSKSDDSVKQGMVYVPTASPQPVSSSMVTSNTPPVTMAQQSILTTIPGPQEAQQISTQLQPPPAHMGIQAIPTLTQPPQAHMGPANSMTATGPAAVPRTIAMNTYIPQSQQSQSSTANNTYAKPTLSMQLPTGGFTLLPNSIQPSGPITISPVGGQPSQQQQSNQQGAQPTQLAQQVAAPQQGTAQAPPVYRIQTHTGQVITIPSIGQLPASSQPGTAIPSPIPTTNQAQPPQLQQPVAVVSGTGSSSAAPLVYQTPQGLVYAAPNTMGTLPEGYIINLPASQVNMQQDQQHSGNTQQYITIPVPAVPVSLAAGSAPMLQPIMAQGGGDSSRFDKDQK